MTLKDDPTPRTAGHEPTPLTVGRDDDQIPALSSGASGAGDLELVALGQSAVEGRNISRGRLVLKRFLRKRLAVAGLIVLVLEVLLAYLGPLFSKWTVAGTDFTSFGLGPGSNGHWFGTDDQGHDVFVQTMSGAQKSMLVGLIAAVLSTGIAAAVGSIAGYFGKFIDNSLMWVVNLMMVVPSFLILAIISPRLHSQSFIVFALLLAAFAWMLTARVVRGLTFSLREREFVSAAKFMGVKPFRIITRHILPNMASLLIVDVTVNVSAVILLETSLSYFGFGVQPPAVSLGTLIGDGTSGPDPTYESWLWVYPGIMLIVLVLAVNFVGDGLRDALDSTSRSGDE
jgi:peptide/nickel transport system permease protein